MLILAIHFRTKIIVCFFLYTGGTLYLKNSAGSGTTLQIDIMLGDRFHLRLTVNSASEELFYFDTIKDYTVSYRLVYTCIKRFRIFLSECP